MPMKMGHVSSGVAAIVAVASMQVAAQRQTLPASGQGSGRGRAAAGAEFAGPPQGPNAVSIVETVGCLTSGANDTWTLTNATDPAKAPAGWSKAEDVKAAEGRALGTQQFRLIGVVELNPAEQQGHKVVVKGLLIQDARGARLNVTSLMSASSTCSK
jgi:hypothetical protein